MMHEATSGKSVPHGSLTRVPPSIIIQFIIFISRTIKRRMESVLDCSFQVLFLHFRFLLNLIKVIICGERAFFFFSPVFHTYFSSFNWLQTSEGILKGKSDMFFFVRRRRHHHRRPHTKICSRLLYNDENRVFSLSRALSQQSSANPFIFFKKDCCWSDSEREKKSLRRLLEESLRSILTNSCCTKN